MSGTSKTSLLAGDGDDGALGPEVARYPGLLFSVTNERVHAHQVKPLGGDGARDLDSVSYLQACGVADVEGHGAGGDVGV